MAMSPKEVKGYLHEAFPNAEIVLEALVNDGNHYKVTITSEDFRGLSRIQQHQKVYAAFGKQMGHELHALSVVTKTPN